MTKHNTGYRGVQTIIHFSNLWFSAECEEERLHLAASIDWLRPACLLPAAEPSSPSRVTCHVSRVTCHYHHDRVTSDDRRPCTTMATVSTSIPQLACHVSRPAPRHVYSRFTRSPWTPGGVSRWSPSERIYFCFAEQNKNGNYVIANTTLEDVLELIILSDNFFWIIKMIPGCVLEKLRKWTYQAWQMLGYLAWI